jgi:hypothetical protein
LSRSACEIPTLQCESERLVPAVRNLCCHGRPAIAARSLVGSTLFPKLDSLYAPSGIENRRLKQRRWHVPKSSKIGTLPTCFFSECGFLRVAECALHENGNATGGHATFLSYISDRETRTSGKLNLRKSPRTASGSQTAEAGDT